MKLAQIVVAVLGVVLPVVVAHGALTPKRGIEEVVVVSTRIAKPISEVPASVSVINITDIQLGRQQLGLDEALNRVPGLFAQNRYNFAQDLRIAIRGFGARANFGIRGLKVFADGIPATTADGQSGVDDIDLGSIERIEVVRGPSSSLYGASAGGVISLFSEDGPATPYLRTALTLGEDQQRKLQLKTGGQAGQLNYMASLTDLTYDGYRDNSKVESTQFNSKFRYDFGDSALTVILNLVDSPTAEDAGAITAAQVDADPSQAQPRNLASNAGESVEQQKIAWRYTHKLNESLDVTVRNYYVWRDFAAFLPIGSHIPFVADDGVVEFDRFFYGGGFEFSFSNELFGLPNRLTAGVDIDIQEDDRQRFINDAGVKGALSFDQVEEAEAYGVFLRDELQVAENLTLILGLRYDDVELSVDDDFLDNADQSSSIDFEEISPVLGFLWKINDNLNLYGNYATAFETPTFTELASPARNLAVSLGGFNNISPQEATSFEMGIKGDFNDGGLFLDAAIYTMSVDDEITSVENIGNRSFFENADTDRRGLELSVVAKISASLRLSFAYTYSDFEFDDFVASPAFNGNELPGLPEHQAYLEFAYRHPKGFYASADLLFVDELFANNANSVVNDDSLVANIRFGYEGGRGRWKWAPFVGVNNLFDEDYNSNVRINGFGGRLFEPAPGINVYAGFTLDYEMR